MFPPAYTHSRNGVFFTAASQPPNIFTARLVENVQGSASSLNSVTSKSPHLVKFSGLRDSPKNRGLGRRLGRLKPKDTLDVDVIVVYKFKQNIVGEKGSVNLTKLLPYSVGGGIFFVGKKKWNRLLRCKNGKENSLFESFRATVSILAEVMFLYCSLIDESMNDLIFALYDMCHFTATTTNTKHTETHLRTEQRTSCLLLNSFP